MSKKSILAIIVVTIISITLVAMCNYTMITYPGGMSYDVFYMLLLVNAITLSLLVLVIKLLLFELYNSKTVQDFLLIRAYKKTLSNPDRTIYTNTNIDSKFKYVQLESEPTIFYPHKCTSEDIEEINYRALHDLLIISKSKK